MQGFKEELLLIASHVLSYPVEEDRQAATSVVDDMELPEQMRHKLQHALKQINELSLKELRETYVSTFDLKAKFGLYLSAHEFGDSPKRGAALIKLQKIIQEAGYERANDELADYMPMLLEFIAVTDESENQQRLMKRLARAFQRILNELPEDNPYYPFVSLLMDEVFEVPTNEELEQMEYDREEADLEEMPYPIMYQ